MVSYHDCFWIGLFSGVASLSGDEGRLGYPESGTDGVSVRFIRGFYGLFGGSFGDWEDGKVSF